MRKPDNEHPDAKRARLYDYHRGAGSLEKYYEMYAMDRPMERER